MKKCYECGIEISNPEEVESGLCEDCHDEYYKKDEEEI